MQNKTCYFRDCSKIGGIPSVCRLKAMQLLILPGVILLRIYDAVGQHLFPTRAAMFISNTSYSELLDRKRL